jgi:hypothetical protein
MSEIESPGFEHPDHFASAIRRSAARVSEAAWNENSSRPAAVMENLGAGNEPDQTLIP